MNLIPQTIITGTEFLADIALAFIAFSTGEFFKFSKLKNNAGKVVIITLAEALTASLFMFILTFWILRLNLAFSIVLAALASATAPASTMMTIRQTQAKGDFVDTLLQVVAYDDMHIFYDLRTTFYTRCEECGVAPPARDEFVGHSSSVLNATYTDLSDEYLLKEGEKLVW